MSLVFRKLDPQLLSIAAQVMVVVTTNSTEEFDLDGEIGFQEAH